VPPGDYGRLVAGNSIETRPAFRGCDSPAMFHVTGAHEANTKRPTDHQVSPGSPTPEIVNVDPISNANQRSHQDSPSRTIMQTHCPPRGLSSPDFVRPSRAMPAGAAQSANSPQHSTNHSNLTHLPLHGEFCADRDSVARLQSAATSSRDSPIPV